MGDTPQTLSPVVLPDKPKLVEQVRNVIRRKHFSIPTEQAYTDWIPRFILFHDVLNKPGLAVKSPLD